MCVKQTIKNKYRNKENERRNLFIVFFSRSFLLRIKLVLMSLYHFRWIFSFGFFFAFAFAFALLCFAFPRNRDIQVVLFNCFYFFFSPLVPFDIANSTQLLQYSYGYNEKKKKNTKKFDYHINLLDYLQDLYTYSMILNVFTYVSN